MVAAGGKARAAPAKAKAATSTAVKKPTAPKASGSKPKSKPKAPGKGKGKLALAANTSIDVPSPTSTTSTPKPSPAKRRKINPNSSQTLLSSQELERNWDKMEEEGRSLGITGLKLVRPPSAQKPKGKSKASIPAIPTEYNMDSTDEESELSEMEVEEENRPRTVDSPPVREATPPYQETVLPPRLRNFDAKPAILVRNQHNWFPGCLVGFIPVTGADSATKRKRRADKYIVEGHPVMKWNAPKELSKSNVMLLDDERIAECPLGSFQTTEQASEKSDAPVREASPDPPINPPPLPSPPDFKELDRDGQIRLLRPHLSQLINETYIPAQSRIDVFYKNYRGSLAKSSLSQKMLFGDIRENEVANMIVPELQRWLLRSCRPEGGDEVVQQGSERFNALTIPEKRNFIQYILIPEIIIRLCIASTEEAELIQYYKAPLPEDTAKGEEENLDSILSQASAVLQTLDGDKEAEFAEDELNVEETEPEANTTNAETQQEPQTQVEANPASPAPSTPTPTANVQLPEPPVPATIDTDTHPTPLMLYQSAKACLQDYANTNWIRIEYEVQRARTAARSAKKLPADNLSAEEKAKAKAEALLKHGGYEQDFLNGGRLRKKHNYATMAG